METDKEIMFQILSLWLLAGTKIVWVFQVPKLSKVESSSVDTMQWKSDISSAGQYTVNIHIFETISHNV